MKKLLLFIILILSIFSIYSSSSFAANSGDYKYDLLEDGSAIIKSYQGKDKNLIIPDEIDGYTVKAIGKEAFAYRENLISVTIPNSVIEIQDNPFVHDKNLERIEVYKEHPCFADIDGVLFNKENRSLLSFPAASKIDYSIPQGIVEIGPYAFSATPIKRIVLPDSMKTIGDSAFKFCMNLHDIEISEGVISIGNCAFEGCSGLSQLDLPESITYIGERAFCDCIFQNIELPSGISSVEQGLFWNCSRLDKITIPDGVISIGDSAFWSCKNLCECILPDGLVSIGDFAFDSCTSLNTISIPDRVIEIGKNPFVGCAGLSNISVSSQQQYFEVVDGVLFRKLDSKLISYPLTLVDAEYTMPQGVECIGAYAFSDNDRLINVYTCSGLQVIDVGAFDDCNRLKHVSLHEGLSSLGSHAVYNCSSLADITIPEGVTKIGSKAFYGCGNMTAISLPESISDIPSHVFDGCPKLTASVVKDSYANQYCVDNNIRCSYADSLDWLNG